MTALADNIGRASATPLLARPGVVAALLLTPCFAWITLFFLLPLGVMISRSLAGEAGSIAVYQDILTSPLYHKVLATTLEMAATTTVLALLTGYPVAYALTKADRSCAASCYFLCSCLTGSTSSSAAFLGW